MASDIIFYIKANHLFLFRDISTKIKSRKATKKLANQKYPRTEFLESRFWGQYKIILSF